jgi:hypothetical protein
MENRSLLNLFCAVLFPGLDPFSCPCCWFSPSVAVLSQFWLGLNFQRDE